MKHIALYGLFFFLVLACSDQVSEVQLVDLSAHNMKIIPEKPTANDEIKLVVFDDCTYNVLSGVTRNNKTIDILKQFNSMMKWPCVMKNDTILIGKLPEGTYIVNYKLLDTSTQVTNPISISFSFSLPVSK
ncbi:MAG: hypothetical protein PHP53_23465 [Prolixibacteraceae bacterium]|nr:hypothetical protein [Prolixibacteraceae bacterium]